MTWAVRCSLRRMCCSRSWAYALRELLEALGVACGVDGLRLRIPGSVFKAAATATEALFKALGASPMLTREKANELLASWEVSTALAEKEIGFVSEIPFAQGARATFEWYLNKGWLR